MYACVDLAMKGTDVKSMSTFVILHHVKMGLLVKTSQEAINVSVCQDMRETIVKKVCLLFNKEYFI